MNLTGLQKKAGRLLSENASTIFTGVGVIGVVATAVLTAQATTKSAELLAEKERELKEEFPDDPADPRMNRELSTSDKIRGIWPYYVPPVVAGGVTIASIVMANRVNAKQIAVLTAAYGLSENRLKEYRDKVQEKLTGPKAQAIDDSIAQDRVNAFPPGNLVVIEGEVLCLDKLTGRYFHSTVERIRQGERAVNQELHMSGYASLSEFYDRIGLEKTQFTDLVGWNTLGSEAALEVKMSATMTPDGRPCMVIDFNQIPRPDAHKLYD